MTDWISVKDRLPEDREDVLLCGPNCLPCIGWYRRESDGFLSLDSEDDVYPTHWMPLPPPPAAIEGKE